MRTSLEQHNQYRICFRGGSVYLIVEAMLWLVAAVVGKAGQTSAAIGVIIFGGMLIHPLTLSLSRLFKLAALPDTNPLPMLSTLCALTIPRGLPLIFLVIRNGDYNLFFPAVAILIGAHWIPFIYIYQMKTFAVLAGLFLAVGIVFGFIYTESFSAAGFISAGILSLFALLHHRLTGKSAPRKTDQAFR